MSEFDLLIRGGLVVDGTNTAPVRADVGVNEDRIVAIAPDLSADDAKTVIDATGRVVAPGFVDQHTHFDAQIHWDPTLDISSRHGYTSFFGGNCGLSLAPITSQSADYMISALSKVEGIPEATIRAGVKFGWESFGEWLDSLEGHVAVNVGFSVGHSALRSAVMGERCLNPDPTPEELDAMRSLLEQSIEEGAVGFTSSHAETHTDLQGRPVASRCSSRAELLALVAVLRGHEGTKVEYSPSADSIYNDDLRQWVADLAVASGRPLDYAIILDQQLTDDQVEAVFHTTDIARGLGGEAYAQVVAQTTSLFYNLRTGFMYESLPDPWPEVYSVSHEERLQMFSDETMLDRLEAAAGLAVERGGNRAKPADFSALIVASVVSPENERFVGRTLGDIAAELGASPFRALVDMALKDDLRTALESRPPEAASNLDGWRRRVGYLRDDRGLITGTDAGAHLDMLDTHAQSSRLIANAVTRFQLMPIEEAVHRLTQVPAQISGLKDRGVLKVGSYADIVVFDPETMGATATELRADLPAGGNRLVCGNTGIDHVIVNGEPLYRNGQYTGSMSGTVLRSGRDTVG
jgi:N-acyl-D-aspartate/D-glutamate deacylase